MVLASPDVPAERRPAPHPRSRAGARGRARLGAGAAVLARARAPRAGEARPDRACATSTAPSAASCPVRSRDATAPTACPRARSRSPSPAPPARASAPGWRAGVTLSLRGETNDYAGKGLSGGILVGAAARERAVPRRGEHDRRQHGAVRRHLRARLLPRPGRRALRGPQLRRMRRSSRASATMAAST